jgi:hypothetical protein
MLGSLAAFETDGGDPELGLTLVSEARHQIGATPHPSPRAWLDATEALSFAAARCGGDAAAHALTRAARAIDADRRTEPPWPWAFPFDHRLPRRRSRTRWPIAQGPARSNGESTDVPGSRLIRMVFFRASGIR